ncbi:MAG: hypothetical protein KC466_18320, partial [Myxococcales bacterium]|nr:hypothetical protein [Myxococcales bacterium]
TPVHQGSIPVGLDAVAANARTNNEVWVVNQISDSVSIVDLAAGNVVRTLAVGDEPADVVFAGDPERAFVSISQENRIKIYDPANPGAAPVVVPIAGEDPRALATDGIRVYAAIFESGNRSTNLERETVSAPGGPYGGDNPPPNAGGGFLPPIAPGLPTPPEVSLIVRKNAAGQWRDVNGADWSPEVTWDLHDHDVAILPAANPNAVTYATGLMNLNMALAVTHDGRVAVVGTDAENEIRFEPNVKGIFTRVIGAVFDPLTPASASRTDLNPHLTYAVRNIPQNERDQSIGDPRGIAWSATSDRAYVSGMGSNNLIITNSMGVRLGRIEVGQGPTGLAWDEGADRLYVLNRFDATLTTIDTTTDTEILPRVGFYDPTPQVIRDGRPFLYSTHDFSGLGQIACGSCHVDGRMDQLAWDLGDPQGAMKPINQNCDLAPCPDWHPMKGPMTTQTLIGIV